MGTPYEPHSFNTTTSQGPLPKPHLKIHSHRNHDSSPTDRVNWTSRHLSLPLALPRTHSSPIFDLRGDNTSSAILGPRIFRCLPPVQARIRRLHIQRCTPGTRRTHEGN